MPQVFSPAADGIARMVLWGLLALVVVLIGVAVMLTRAGWFTGAGRMPDQPVPFSHRHHVGGLGIDCRYCHGGVETSGFAGLPATETCMTCHSQLWTEAGVLAPVRRSLVRGEPLRWTRVHDLADFVYFNHSAHIANGVGCETCHGDVAAMPMTRQGPPLTMSWCLDCHRDPAPNLRPPEAIFAMGWKGGGGPEAQAALMARYDIHPEIMTDCYVCHR